MELALPAAPRPALDVPTASPPQSPECCVSQPAVPTTIEIANLPKSESNLMQLMATKSKEGKPNTPHLLKQRHVIHLKNAKVEPQDERNASRSAVLGNPLPEAAMKVVAMGCLFAAITKRRPA